MSDGPLVSLVLVTYNSVDLLAPFFAALATTEYAPYELIVVDNASADGTVEQIAGRYPAARVIANVENVGFGRACNQGAQAARGEIIVFLNPDVEATPEWLARLVRRSAAYPDAILCPTTLYPGQTLPAASAPVEEVAAVPGAALLVRREVWAALGGFDERMFLYWEDTELCWRAWLLGFRVMADLETFVFHRRGGSTGGQRWDAERAKNSLYTHLKLMPWRVALPFALGLLPKTLAKAARWRDTAMLRAWSWNARHLGETLARRRELARRRAGDPKALQRRIHEQERRLRAERRVRVIATKANE